MISPFRTTVMAGLLLALSTGIAHAGIAAVGKQAPAFRLIDLRGAPVTLARFRGKPLFINVFASWCSPCRAELPDIVKAHARFAGRVEFLGVDSQESSRAARRFGAEMKMRYLIAIDRGQMAVTYGASSVPESIFVGRDGIVRAVVKGPVPIDVLQRDLAMIAR